MQPVSLSHGCSCHDSFQQQSHHNEHCTSNSTVHPSLVRNIYFSEHLYDCSTTLKKILLTKISLPPHNVHFPSQPTKRTMCECFSHVTEQYVGPFCLTVRRISNSPGAAGSQGLPIILSTGKLSLWSSACKDHVVFYLFNLRLCLTFAKKKVGIQWNLLKVP